MDVYEVQKWWSGVCTHHNSSNVRICLENHVTKTEYYHHVLPLTSDDIFVTKPDGL